MILKSDLHVQQTHLREQSGEQSYNFQVRQILQLLLLWICSHFVVMLKFDLHGQETHLREQFGEQMLVLGYSFQVWQILQ